MTPDYDSRDAKNVPGSPLGYIMELMGYAVFPAVISGSPGHKP